MCKKWYRLSKHLQHSTLKLMFVISVIVFSFIKILSTFLFYWAKEIIHENSTHCLLGCNFMICSKFMYNLAGYSLLTCINCVFISQITPKFIIHLLYCCTIIFSIFNCLLFWISQFVIYLLWCFSEARLIPHVLVHLVELLLVGAFTWLAQICYRRPR